MTKKYLRPILLLLLLILISYSFSQHMNASLDGDMADAIMPSQWFQKVLEDPFGLSVLFKNEVYAAPNRFFAHWTYSNYFKIIPGVLQNFVSPVDSIYLASAIAKTAIQVFLILLLAAYISGKKNIFSTEFLLAAVLVAPFFISYEYYRFAIIYDSITVTFFYPLPVSFLILFLLPFFKKLFYGEEISANIFYRIFLIVLGIILCLSGPTIPGIILVVCPAVLLNLGFDHFREASSLPFIRRLLFSFKKIPKEILFYFMFVILLSLYSLYIGRNNIENNTVQTSLADRYALLPGGFVKLFFQMPLVLILIIMVTVNALLIRKYFNAIDGDGRKILNFLKWTVICSVIYILLLPLGGYRIYRPDILSFDIMLPVTLSLILIFGLSSYFLIFNLSGKFKVIFSSVIILYLSVYCYENKSTSGNNSCERNALNQISESTDSVVIVSSDCTVMSWDKIKDYKESELNAEMLKYWGVTKEKKLYYQK